MSPEEQTSSPVADRASKGAKRTRTRSGCQNCRRKKRKCDERRPSCGTCKRRHEHCEWGLRISFRDENAWLFDKQHPSMRALTRKTWRNIEIIDVTPEVIRDYHLPSDDEGDDNGDRGTRRAHAAEPAPPPPPSNASLPPPSATTYPAHHVMMPDAAAAATSSPASLRHTENAVANLILLSQGGPGRATTAAADHPVNVHAPFGTVPADMVADYYLHGQQHQQQQQQTFTPEGPSEDGVFLPGSAYHELHSTLRNHLIQEVRSDAASPDSRGEGVSEDGDAQVVSLERPTGKVVPGLSEQQNQHHHQQQQQQGYYYQQQNQYQAQHHSQHQHYQHQNQTMAAPMGSEDETALWRNWFDEIAPWLDKFDHQRHFQIIIPGMAAAANSNPNNPNGHLRASMLALSARQLELRSGGELPPDRSLALYGEAIHLLLPQLPTRSTAVIASCVVLCVLEMLSCSPKAWRRHLDGCASLMEAVGIDGCAGGVEEALFWCFARMDVCGGLISSVKTLIPVEHWVSESSLSAVEGAGNDGDGNINAGSGMDMDEGNTDTATVTATPTTTATTPTAMTTTTTSARDVAERFRCRSDFESWSHYSVYLLARVLHLLAPDPLTTFKVPSLADPRYRAHWLQLWTAITEWYAARPAPLHAILTVPSSDSASPFPTVLFSNPAAVSGNQLHHTASILMLQNQPANVDPNLTPGLDPALPLPVPSARTPASASASASASAAGPPSKPAPRPKAPPRRSILWHARQICAISISNHHHGAWTNSVQPLWIAGRCMSHPAEHRAIVDVLERIERESGWGARWRAEDLKEYWGDLGE